MVLLYLVGRGVGDPEVPEGIPNLPVEHAQNPLVPVVTDEVLLGVMSETTGGMGIRSRGKL